MSRLKELLALRKRAKEQEQTTISRATNEQREGENSPSLALAIAPHFVLPAEDEYSPYF